MNRLKEVSQHPEKIDQNQLIVRVAIPRSRSPSPVSCPPTPTGSEDDEGLASEEPNNSITGLGNKDKTRTSETSQVVHRQSNEESQEAEPELEIVSVEKLTTTKITKIPN